MEQQASPLERASEASKGRPQLASSHHSRAHCLDLTLTWRALTSRPGPAPCPPEPPSPLLRPLASPHHLSPRPSQTRTARCLANPIPASTRQSSSTAASARASASTHAQCTTCALSTSRSETTSAGSSAGWATPGAASLSLFLRLSARMSVRERGLTHGMSSPSQGRRPSLCRNCQAPRRQAIRRLPQPYDRDQSDGERHLRGREVRSRSFPPALAFPGGPGSLCGPARSALGRASEDEVLMTRLLEKALRRSNAVDREALCIVAGQKVRPHLLLLFRPPGHS